MVARDEADVVEATVRHALWHTDEVICADHRSVDGTAEILADLPVTLYHWTERAFDGPAIWTWLAREALQRGHEWLLVNDADDVWHVTDDPDARIADYLAGLHSSVMVVGGASFNHVPTALDPEEPNPLLRIQWRQVGHDARKVACRLSPDLTYHEHGAWYRGIRARPAEYPLRVRHFTIRSADQLVNKVRVGMDGYSVEAGCAPGADEGWNQWKGLSDDDIRERFRLRFWSDDPAADRLLVHDPAPVKT